MSSKKVLIVEDDTDSRLSLITILEILGYDTLAFGRPEEALKAMQANPNDIAIALLDIMMPVMNGYELLAELKKIPALESIPYIMVTAKDEDSEVLDGYRHGADYYITKPFTSHQIQYGLKLFLEGTKPEKETIS